MLDFICVVLGILGLIQFLFWVLVTMGYLEKDDIVFDKQITNKQYLNMIVPGMFLIIFYEKFKKKWKENK